MVGTSESAIWRTHPHHAILLEMPRQPRIDATGAIQHVIARGNADTPIVLDDDDRRALLAGLARSHERYGWLIHAYCFMNTHIHVVIETPEPNLSAGMRRWIGGYAFEFNRRHERYGHLFAGPFWAKLIDTEAYAVRVGAYIVLNPVRAGLVNDPADWRWSSYRASAGLVRKQTFLETRLLPGMLDPDETRARDLYRELIREVATEHPAQAEA
jgi:putative transposase